MDDVIPLLDLQLQLAGIRSEVDAAISEVLDSGTFVLGPQVSAFEDELAHAHGARFAIACNSGTSALHLALLAMGVGPGDEVITVSMTYGATAAAILYTGATPVLIDVDPGTLTMDPDLLESAITARTRAIIPVHLHGRLADMARICPIAEEHGIPILEDAAQAHLALDAEGNRVGAFGRAAALSFYPGKNLGAAGEGGAILTNDTEVNERSRLLRNWGGTDRYDHQTLGFNYRMDAIQAAILRVKLMHLADWTEGRIAVAERYKSVLADNPSVTLPAPSSGLDHVFHVFSVRVAQHQRVATEMMDCGVSTGFHYPVPVHLQSAYRTRVSVASSLSESERFAETCLSLPIYPELTDNQLDRVASTLESTLP